MYFSLASKTDSLLRLWLFIRKLDIGRNFFFSIDNNNMYRQHFGTTHFHLHMTFSHRWPYPFNSSKLSYLPKRLTDSFVTHFYSVVKKVHCSVTKRTYNISEFNSKISRLKEWLGPLRSLTHYTQEGLPVIIEQMKSFTEDILKLPRGLITVLRILRHLCIAPPNEYPEGKVDALQTCLIYRLRNKQLYYLYHLLYAISSPKFSCLGVLNHYTMWNSSQEFWIIILCEIVLRSFESLYYVKRLSTKSRNLNVHKNVVSWNSTLKIIQPYISTNRATLNYQ